jgi:hypothetical protein
MNELQNTNTKTEVAEKKYFTLLPQNLTEATDLAERYSKSGMVPKNYINNPGAILAAWDFGGSLGLGLMQSLQGIAVINGMPTLWGDAALAVVMASGLLDDIDESIPGQCTVIRKGKKPKTTYFSMEDAALAGLTRKEGPWKQYPKRMLQMRNRAFALRDSFADVLKGMQIAEEVQDYVNPYPNAVNVEPKKFESVLNENKSEIVSEHPESKDLNLSLDEMNQMLKLQTSIRTLRKSKEDVISRKFSADAIRIMDSLIDNCFVGKTLAELQEQEAFLTELK